MESLQEGLQGWAPGTVIDGLYEIKKMVGLGGMGAVFQARHLDWDLEMAIKVARPDVQEAGDLRERLIREGEAWIGLGVHPNIAQCYFIREYFGYPALFLDYLTGGSLEDWMKKQLIPKSGLPRILDIVIQAADGLEHAHRNGMLHRDVKPANLLVRGDETICVTDFGIVKSLEESAPATDFPELKQFASEARLDTTVCGTVGYGAPEQWITGASVGPAIDVYALGVVLYELVTGRRLFKIGSNPFTTLVRQRNADPDPITDPIPDFLKEAVMCCVAREPERRPESALEMRQLLAACYHRLTGENYPRPLPKVVVERADSLNNRAASLYYMGKDDEAAALWREASGIDGKHEAVLYNRLKTEWQKGAINAEDVEWRLHEAGALWPLGLFCTYVGHPKTAAKMLETALEGRPEEEMLRIYSALGDSLMYQSSFGAAEKAYARVVAVRPQDINGRFRRRLARVGQREVDGKIYFPSNRPVRSRPLPGPIVRGFYHRGSRVALLVGADGLVCWDVVGGKALWSRGLSAVPTMAVDQEHLYLLGHSPARKCRLVDGQVIWEHPEPLLFIHQQTGLGVRGSQVVKLADGQPVSTLQQLKAPLNCGGFTANGRLLLAGDNTGFVGLWTSSDGVLNHGLRFADSPLEQMVLLGSRAQGLASDAGGNVHIFDPIDQTKHRKIAVGRRTLELLLDSRESLFAARLEPVPGQPDFMIWDFELEKVFEGSGAFAFTDDGNVLIDREGALELWSLARGRRLRRLAPHKQQLTFIATTRGATLAFTASAQAKFEVWELDEAHRLVHQDLLLVRGKSHAESTLKNETFTTHLRRAQEYFDRRSYGLAFGELQQAKKVEGYARDVELLNLMARLARHLARTQLAAIWERFSSRLQHPTEGLTADFDGLRAFTLHQGRLWAYQNQVQPFQIQVGQPVGCLTYLHGKDRLMIGTGTELRFFDLDNRRLGGESLSLPSSPCQLRASSDGRYVAVLEQAGGLSLVQTEPLTMLKAIPNQAEWLAVTPNLDFGLTGPEVRFWNLPQGQLIWKARSLKKNKKLVRDTSQFVAGALTDDGKVAVLAGPDHLISVWDTETRRCRRTMSGHQDRVVYVGVWNHLHVAISASWDGCLVLWDLKTGEVLRLVEPHEGSIVFAWADSVGRYVITEGDDGVIRVWELEWDLDRNTPAVSLLEALGPVKTLDKIGSFFRSKK